MKSQKQNIRIVYPFPMKLSNGYTYMLSIMQFLNALSNEVNVDLICLDQEKEIREYLTKKLSLKVGRHLNVVSVKNSFIGIKSNKLFFYKKIVNYLNKLSDEKIYIYTRDIKQMKLLLKKYSTNNYVFKFIFESHQILSQNYCREGKYKNAEEFKKIEKLVFGKVDYLISISNTLSSEIEKIYPNSQRKQIVLPVGFDKRFMSLNNEKKKYDIIYSGNFSSWKGIDTLLKSLEILHKKYNIEPKVLLVGVHSKEKEYYLDQAKSMSIKNITILTRQDHKKIFDLVGQSRIGILSNNFQGDGMLFTSPLKLFEYLGAGLRVVVSRLPSIVSTINEEYVYFAIPESPSSFAHMIITALDDTNFDASRVREYSKQFTWESRVQRFLEFLE